LPADLAYDRIPAWQLLQPNPPALPHVANQVVIIAPGGYGEAGVSGSTDYFPMPAAMRYWRDRRLPDTMPIYTGAEAHAYMVHHLLRQRLVIPVPDLWMVAIAALLGKVAVTTVVQTRRQEATQRRRHHRRITAVMGGSTLVYGLASLQLYVTSGILLPVVLPVVMVWVYLLPSLRSKSNV
ncbi:MAG TPA: CHASE2 domain-containing protein, partial [Chroococcidiopsis sp.]